MACPHENCAPVMDWIAECMRKPDDSVANRVCCCSCGPILRQAERQCFVESAGFFSMTSWFKVQLINEIVSGAYSRAAFIFMATRVEEALLERGATI